jgi:hypothetical protein
MIVKTTRINRDRDIDIVFYLNKNGEIYKFNEMRSLVRYLNYECNYNDNLILNTQYFRNSDEAHIYEVLNKVEKYINIYCCYMPCSIIYKNKIIIELKRTSRRILVDRRPKSYKKSRVCVIKTCKICRFGPVECVRYEKNLVCFRIKSIFSK